MRPGSAAPRPGSARPRAPVPQLAVPLVRPSSIESPRSARVGLRPASAGPTRRPGSALPGRPRTANPALLQSMQEYTTNSVTPVMRPLLEALLTERPADVEAWIIEHLSNKRFSSQALDANGVGEYVVVGAVADEGFDVEEGFEDFSEVEGTEQEMLMATRIQAMQRGNASRRDLQEQIAGFGDTLTMGDDTTLLVTAEAEFFFAGTDKEVGAAGAIQARYRGGRERRELQEQQDAALRIQAIQRGKQARRQQARALAASQDYDGDGTIDQAEAAMLLEGSDAQREVLSGLVETVEAGFGDVVTVEEAAQVLEEVAEAEAEQDIEAKIEVMRDVAEIEGEKFDADVAAEVLADLEGHSDESATKIQAAYRGRKARASAQKHDEERV